MPTKLKPDPTRFSFQIPGVPARFSVVGFSVTESISLPFQLDVRMTSKEDIPFEEVMNRPALLTVSKARSYRYFHGIITVLYTPKRAKTRWFIRPGWFRRYGYCR